MLMLYHSVIDSLDHWERKLLQTHLVELNRIMKPGFTRLNWNSLGISDFIQKCSMEITQLRSLLNQIRKNTSLIQHAVRQIEHTQLVVDPSTLDSGELMDTYVGLTSHF